MKEKLKQAYMRSAHVFAECSTAEKLQVGAVVVKDNRIISIGYNGMPAGWDNCCEDTVIADDGSTSLKTKPEVLHAEANAITKLARSSESGEGATMFCTHSPCLPCAKLIYGSGIDTVYYETDYRSDEGVEFLEKAGVKIQKL